MNRIPIVHLLLDFHGQPAPALETIWDFILADASVLQCIRDAAAYGNDVVISALTGAAGVLAACPNFDVRQANPTQFVGHDAYVLTPSVPDGASEVRVHLIGRQAVKLAILIQRYWPQQMQRAG